MSIRKNLNVRQGYMLRRDEFVSDIISVTSGETGRIRDHEIDANQEWFLEAKVAVTFWANKAQYQTAREIAEKALMAELYSDVLVELRMARLAISNGDKIEAFKVIDRIQNIIEG
jgi:hypothetical protein